MRNSIHKSTMMVFAVFALFLFAANSAQAQTEGQIKKQIPDFEKSISEGCDGARVALEVDFASFTATALTYVPSQGLEEVADALRRYCTNSNRTSETDDEKVGKLKSKVKKVVLRFVPKPAQKKISFKTGGVLLIEAAFGETGGRFYTSDIQAALSELP